MLRAIIILNFTITSLYANQTDLVDKARLKALAITKTLAPYFTSKSIDLKEIERGKNGFNGSVVTTLICKSVVVSSPNGMKTKGAKCTIGLGSGLHITFDSKLNPIDIGYFVP